MSSDQTMSTASSSSLALVKAMVLLCLMMQNAGHALLTRYASVLKLKYRSSEVVMVAELIKLVVSIYLAYNPEKGFRRFIYLMFRSNKIIVLVILYGIGNLLSYFILSRVDASVYTVGSQLKILSTAGLSVVMLKRDVSVTKWRALNLLVIGCILVASPTFNKTPTIDDLQQQQLSNKGSNLGISSSELSGMLGLVAMTLCSGFSSVYLEGILKKDMGTEHIGIWERNFQLSLFSVLVMIGMVFVEANNNARSRDETDEWDVFGRMSLFSGWSPIVVGMAILQAAGGLLVAMVLKYADSILKVLATSGSIVVSTVVGWLFLGGTVDIFVCLGVWATLLAIFNYMFDATTTKEADPSVIK
jgi:UDP-sugar transporter A1/2/3